MTDATRRDVVYLGPEDDLVHVPVAGTLGTVMHGFRYASFPQITSTHSLVASLARISHIHDPSHFKTLLIFILGGITQDEIDRMTLVAEMAGIRLIIGSTEIVSAQELLKRTLL